ncbi:MAG: cyclic nucleotide-binding domain-containing protein [Acidobacteriota bacterium]
MAVSTRKTALFIEAEKLRLDQRFDAAIPVYEAILKEDPNDVGVRKTLAGLYLMGGDPKRTVVGYMLLATTMVAEGKLEQAEALVNRVRALDRDGSFKKKLNALADRIFDMKAEQLVLDDEDKPEADTTDVERDAKESATAGISPGETPAAAAAEEEDPDTIIEIEEIVEFEDVPAEEPVTFELQEELAPGAAPARPPARTVAPSVAPVYEELVVPADATPAPKAPAWDAELEAADAELASLKAEAQREASDTTKSAARLNTALLKSLPPDAMNQVIRSCEKVTIPAGGEIFQEGVTCRSLYIMGSGSCSLRARRTEDGQVVEVAKQGPGDLLGLMAFLTDAEQEATIVAEHESMLYELFYEDAETLMADYPSFGEAVVELYRDRVITLFMATSQILSALPEAAQEALVAAFELMSVRKDEVIVTEGTVGSDLFFIKKGEVKAVTGRSGYPVELARMKKHEFFGEIAFLTGGPRTASVVATCPTELLRVRGERMQSIVDAHPAVRDRLRAVQVQHALEAAKKLSGKL